MNLLVLAFVNVLYCITVDFKSKIKRNISLTQIHQENNMEICVKINTKNVYMSR
jgi:hypothetical protein